MTDLPGQAIYDYHFKLSKAKLYVHDEFGPRVEMPVKMYFRSEEEMPLIEQKALKQCKGNILDIGAGAGSHALWLQNQGLDVAALEISPKACEVMHSRGIKNVVCKDIFKYSEQKFDTLLLLMNGIGLCGTLKGFEDFLTHAASLLNAGGRLVFDSCDIAYMFEDEDLPEFYYGEVKCRYEYQKQFTEWFKWMYLDQQTMKNISGKLGWSSEIIFEDDQYQYLSVLSKIE